MNHPIIHRPVLSYEFATFVHLILVAPFVYYDPVAIVQTVLTSGNFFLYSVLRGATAISVALQGTNTWMKSGSISQPVYESLCVNPVDPSTALYMGRRITRASGYVGQPAV